MDTLGWWPLFVSGCSREVVAVFADKEDGGASRAGTGGRDHVVRLVRSDSQRLCNATGPQAGHLFGMRTGRPFMSVSDPDFATHQIDLRKDSLGCKVS